MSILDYSPMVCSAAVSVFLVNAAQGQVPPPELDAGLDAYVNQFLIHGGIEYHAQVEIRLFAEMGANFRDDGSAITASFDGWARDARYRQRMLADPVGYPGLDKVVAFDGVFAQEMRYNENYLSVKTGDTPGYGVLVPDPLAESLQFLYPITDDDPVSSVRFTTPMVDTQLSSRIASVDWISWDQTSAVGEFPGSTLESTPYIHRVTFSRTNGILMPQRVERVSTSTNTLMSSLESSGTVSLQSGGQSFYWPTTVQYKAFAPDGTIMGQFVYTITIDMSGAFNDSVFILSKKPGMRLWDVDLQTFVP